MADPPPAAQTSEGDEAVSIRVRTIEGNTFELNVTRSVRSNAQRGGVGVRVACLGTADLEAASPMDAADATKHASRTLSAWL